MKKLTAFFLAVLMLLGMFPAALAEEVPFDGFSDACFDELLVAYMEAADKIEFLNSLKEKESETNTEIEAMNYEEQELSFWEQFLLYLDGREIEIPNEFIELVAEIRERLGYEQPVNEEPVYEELVTEGPVLENPEIEEPVFEKPKIEEPVFEEPKIEEPALEEPEIEEPVLEEPQIKEAVTEEAVHEAPVINKPVIEESVIKEPMVEESATEEPIIEESIFDESGENSSLPEASPESLIPSPSEAVSSEPPVFMAMPLFETEPTEKYLVIVSAAIEHGKVTADPSTAASGETVMLSAVPASGFRFIEFIVTSPENERLNVDENGQFIMPPFDVTITASFVALPTEKTENETVNFGSAALNLSGDEIIEKILAEDDIAAMNSGAPVSAWLSVQQAAEPSGEDKEIIDRKIQAEMPNGYDAAIWLDISLMKQVDNAEPAQTQPNSGKSIIISLDLPNDFVKNDREYKLIHIHEDTADFIDGVTVENGRIVFQTSSFSNFGILGVGPWEVSFNMNGHGSQIASQIVPDGGNASEPTHPAAAGYEFKGWYTDAGCSSAYDFSSMVKEDTVLYAKWEEKPVTVSFNMNSHGSQIPAQTLPYGSKAAKPADPSADGYRFKGWFAKNDYRTPYDFNKPVTSDTVLYAKWVRISKVTVYVNDIARGNISGESVRILEEGENYTFHAQITSKGYYLGRVKVDGVVVSGLQGAGTVYAAYQFINADATHDHTVEFVIFDSNGAPATGDAAAPIFWALLGLCSLASALFLSSRVSRKKTHS